MADDEMPQPWPQEDWPADKERYGVYLLTPARLAYLQQGGTLAIELGPMQALIQIAGHEAGVQDGC